MSQTRHGNLEGGGDPEEHHNQRRTTTRRWSMRSTTFRGNLPSDAEESEFKDSAWPLYSIYSNIAEDEINRTVERCQRDTDGTLIFSGLFSATIGAVLTISIPDLKANSQDTSAFYLKNIYQLQVSGDPNVSHPSISSALAEPPAFSPPTYAIWVNSLWFLSLALSLSSAMHATMDRNWAVHYFEITQRPWHTPVKRARNRAFFAQGYPGPYSIWGTNHTHAYLHFALIFFTTGGLIYLFNTNPAVFYAVVSWVGYMAIPYTSVGGVAAVAG